MKKCFLGLGFKTVKFKLKKTLLKVLRYCISQLNTSSCYIIKNIRAI